MAGALAPDGENSVIIMRKAENRTSIDTEVHTDCCEGELSGIGMIMWWGTDMVRISVFIFPI